MFYIFLTPFKALRKKNEETFEWINKLKTANQVSSFL